MTDISPARYYLIFNDKQAGSRQQAAGSRQQAAGSRQQAILPLIVYTY
jgi:hypothetical protein